MDFILVVDTSLYGVSMGIFQADKLAVKMIWESYHIERYGSAKTLTEMLKEGLKVAQITLGHIKKIFVSTGPGSFTGIKVGIAWAEGLKAGLPSTQLFPYSGIETAAIKIFNEREVTSLNVLLPVTKTHGFMISISGNTLSAIQLVELESEEGRYKILSTTSDEVLVIDAWEKMENFLADNGKIFQIVSWEKILMSAIREAENVIKSFQNLDLEDTYLQPNYMRQSTAEERLKNKEQKNG